jgi:hypothetical protein
MDRFTSSAQEIMPGIIQFQAAGLGDHHFHGAVRPAQSLIVGSGFYTLRRFPAAQ